MRILFVTVAVVVFCAPLFAQQPQQDPDDRFAALDADRSDGINPQEARASPTVTQLFSKLDTNGDGILTREEFHAAFPAKQPKLQTPPPSTPPK